MISEAICVAPTGDRCGEGVLWHEAHTAVYWTDINRFLIHRFNVADQTMRSWFFHEPVIALAPDDVFPGVPWFPRDSLGGLVEPSTQGVFQARLVAKGPP